MKLHYCASLLPVLVACSSSPDTPHLEFTSQSYSLQPGEEKYLCYTTNLPADRDVVLTKFTPTYGPGTHHILFSQTAPTAPEPDGVSECKVLSKSTWAPVYAGGKDSNPLQLPDNTGFVPFVRGQQLVMQLHLQNAGDAPISGQTAMRVDFEDASPDIIPAGFVGFDNRVLNIPPHSTGEMNEMNCVINQDLNVFGVLGHMHKHGTHIDLSRGPTAGVEMLYQEDWNFDAQPIAPVSFQLKPDDNLFLRCQYRNDGDAPLLYGESSDTEMCVLIMYYAPARQVRGCVNTGQASAAP